ncbi:MAG: cob(I)yrinic acid a,c-diamide adenosyltransferase [Bdellovibrionales bacterium]|nr:cob(I)yrinic acid a,c-diamide adenosyltransferase [Bdellovibrionales bacterium]
MVKLSKLYTRQGDSGETGLIGGVRVKKSNRQVEAYGDIDELNSWIGVLRACLKESSDITLQKSLPEIQQNLFDIGAELATPAESEWKSPSLISANEVTTLEKDIDAWTSEVPELKSFLLPGGGSQTTSFIHVARTVCRRAERSIILLTEDLEVRAEVVQYINRLSDWLFALARVTAHRNGEQELLWDTSRK